MTPGSGGAAAATGLDTVIVDGVGTLTSLVEKVFELLTANPLLVVFLAASLITLGLSVFRKLKRTAK